MTADADAEVDVFNACGEWCKDQAQDDGHQRETLDASIASTGAAIENFAAKAESAFGPQQIPGRAFLNNVVAALHCSSRCGSFF